MPSARSSQPCRAGQNKPCFTTQVRAVSSGLYLQYFPDDVDLYGGVSEALVAAAFRFRNAVGVFTLTEIDLERLTRLTRKTIRGVMRRMRSAGHLTETGTRNGKTPGLRLARQEGVQSPNVENEHWVDCPNERDEQRVNLPNAYKEIKEGASAKEKSTACADGVKLPNSQNSAVLAPYPVENFPPVPQDIPSQSCQPNPQGEMTESPSRFLRGGDSAIAALYSADERSEIASKLARLKLAGGQFIQVTGTLVDKICAAAGGRVSGFAIADWLDEKAEQQRKTRRNIPDGPGYFVRAVGLHFNAQPAQPSAPPPPPRKPPTAYAPQPIAQNRVVNASPSWNGAQGHPAGRNAEEQAVCAARGDERAVPPDAQSWKGQLLTTLGRIRTIR